MANRQQDLNEIDYSARGVRCCQDQHQYIDESGINRGIFGCTRPKGHVGAHVGMGGPEMEGDYPAVFWENSAMQNEGLYGSSELWNTAPPGTYRREKPDYVLIKFGPGKLFWISHDRYGFMTPVVGHYIFGKQWQLVETCDEMGAPRTGSSHD